MRQPLGRSDAARRAMGQARHLFLHHFRRRAPQIFMGDVSLRAQDSLEGLISLLNGDNLPVGDVKHLEHRLQVQRGQHRARLALVLQQEKPG